MRISSRPRLALAVLTCVLSLPFLDQAFHIDDRIYLEVAEQILRDPLHPYDYPVVFEGLVSPDAASHSHLPSTSYYLALVSLLAGPDREWAFHAAFLIFPVLAALSFYDLARRLLRHPLAAGALLAVSPGFLVLSHTIMADIPLLAFWLLALSRYLRLAEGEGCRLDWAGCVLGLAGAAFTSLLSAGLVLLIAAHWTLSRWRRDEALRLSTARFAVLLAIPLAIWAIWYFRAYLHYDRIVLINTYLHMEKREIFDWEINGIKMVSYVLNLGGMLLFPPAIWFGLVRIWSLRAALLVFLAAFIPFYLWIDGWTWIQKLLFAVFLSSGFLVFWAAARWQIPSWRRRECGVDESRGPESAPLVRKGTGLVPSPLRTTILLWFFGIFAAAILLYYSGSVRYTILAAPPAILIWLNSLERLIRGNAYLLRNLIWLGFFLTLPYSLWIAHADQRLAGLYRQEARQVVEDYSHSGRTIWFTAEWGLRRYLERNGARLLASTAVGPKPGDIIVKPYVSFPWRTLYDGDEYVSLAEQRRLKAPGLLRTLHFSSKAGFYSTGWGILPWGLTDSDGWDHFNIYRVRKSYDGPIPRQERHW